MALQHLQQMLLANFIYHSFLPSPTFPKKFIMARFTAFKRNKLHQVLKIASNLPKRLTYAFLSFSLYLCLFFSLILGFVGCSDISKGTFL